MCDLSSTGIWVQAGIKPTSRTMVTTVKTLSLKVRFGNHNDVKMLPTFLRCFPNLEKLHITVCAFLRLFQFPVDITWIVCSQATDFIPLQMVCSEFLINRPLGQL
jgi:hypothetical protein